MIEILDILLIEIARYRIFSQLLQPLTVIFWSPSWTDIESASMHSIIAQAIPLCAGAIDQTCLIIILTNNMYLKRKTNNHLSRIGSFEVDYSPIDLQPRGLN